MPKRDQTLSEEELAQVREAMAREVAERPPTIGLIGVSGVGKSYTINRLFKTTLPTSDTVACTKEFSATDLALSFTRGHARKLEVELRVVDAPGLGEDVARDPEYLEMYRKKLPACDVIVWILAARNRAMSLDQHYLAQLEAFHDRMVFALNQVDLVEPMDWNMRVNLPSKQQSENIQTIVTDRESKIVDVLGRRVSVEAYSAKHGYRLEELFARVITTTPPKRRWILDNLKNFSYRDFIPATAFGITGGPQRAE